MAILNLLSGVASPRAWSPQIKTSRKSIRSAQSAITLAHKANNLAVSLSISSAPTRPPLQKSSWPQPRPLETLHTRVALHLQSTGAPPPIAHLLQALHCGRLAYGLLGLLAASLAELRIPLLAFPLPHHPQPHVTDCSSIDICRPTRAARGGSVRVARLCWSCGPWALGEHGATGGRAPKGSLEVRAGSMWMLVLRTLHPPRRRESIARGGKAGAML